MYAKLIFDSLGEMVGKQVRAEMIFKKSISKTIFCDWDLVNLGDTILMADANNSLCINTQNIEKCENTGGKIEISYNNELIIRILNLSWLK